MSDVVWRRLVSGEYERIPATLAGYARKQVKGERYPGLIEAPNSSVEGIVYRDVALEDVLRLDAFEGEEYELTAVEVITASGAGLRCETYLFRLEFRHLLSEEDWHYVEFLNKGIGAFLDSYKGWNFT